jgi:regulator of sigma E protease
MEFLIKTAQFILSLSIIVTLHEMGHFIPARWFGIRVEKFFLFFDVKWSIWEKKIGDTIYGIGWLPLGGYVKIAGMIDESMDTEQMAQEPQPDEFRSKPAWQRLIVMVGGVIVNLILGLMLYAMVLFVWGKEYIPLTEMKYGLHVNEVLIDEGLQEGDLVTKVNGEAVYKIEEITKRLLIDKAESLTVTRGGQEVNIALSEGITDRMLESGASGLFAIRVPFVIDTVLDGGAKEAGVHKGDRIVSVNGAPTAFFYDFVKTVTELPGETITLEVERNGDRMKMPVQVSEQGTIGAGHKNPREFFDVVTERYGLLESIPAGIDYGLSILVSYAKSLKLLFSSAGLKQMGGFGTIGGLYSATWDWQTFWTTTAFVSIILGFMNILPIPALDGGHVVFLIWEMATGKPAPQRILEVAQMIGIILLIGLMLYANVNDIYKFFFKG